MDFTPSCSTIFVAAWTLSGSLENWELSLKSGIWGVSEKAKGLWGKVKPGDNVVFYAVKVGIIGYGVIEDKFISQEPLWPRERREGRALWPYRFKIKVERSFGKPLPRPKNMLVNFGINKLSEEIFEQIKRLY